MLIPKNTCFLFLMISIFCFSQDEKMIHGKVLSGETALKDIDVVNMNSKKSSTTDSNGNFTILAKTGDELFIISKEYVDKKMVITQEQLDQNNLLIPLEKKPIELDDVEITTAPSIKYKVSQAELDIAKLSKQAKTLKVQNVYTGEIENGIDFIRLGKGLINLFKKKDEDKPKKPLPPIPFKDYLSANFDNAFYTQKLKLKPEEIALFISFCEADPKAKTISERQDVLETLSFLLAKNEEFKELER